MRYSSEPDRRSGFQTPWVIGHRGGIVKRSENTFLTYDYSLENGVTSPPFEALIPEPQFVTATTPAIDRE